MGNSKKWCCRTLGLVLAVTALLGGLTALIDPFFHYHAPLEGVSYRILEQRYQNDGIVKHFSYDAMITGTSMTENFRTSELDGLFGVRSVKVPFSGASFKEIDGNLQRAIRANPRLSMVVRSLDGYMLLSHKDEMRTDAEYPEYLYDDSLFNDASYLFNLEVLLNHTVKALQYTVAGKETTSFDVYSFWADQHAYGPEQLLENHSIPEEYPESCALDEAAARVLRENVLQNVTATALENPDIEFYYYFPPYSIVWWSGEKNDGRLDRQMDAFELATEEILKCENIHLFSFVDDREITTDLYNYTDREHHTAQVNSKILEDMRAGKNLLTWENYQSYWEKAREFYGDFDYAGCFAGYGYPVDP